MFLTLDTLLICQIDLHAEHYQQVLDVANVLLSKFPCSVAPYLPFERDLSPDYRTQSSYSEYLNGQLKSFRKADCKSLPSDTFEARSKTPTTGFVTALGLCQETSQTRIMLGHSPNQSFSNTLEETYSSFRFCAFDWFHLNLGQETP